MAHEPPEQCLRWTVQSLCLSKLTAKSHIILHARQRSPTAQLVPCGLTAMLGVSALGLRARVCIFPARVLAASHRHVRVPPVQPFNFSRAAFGNIADKGQEKNAAPTTSSSTKQPSHPQVDLVPEENVGHREQRRRDRRIVGQLIKHIWPKGDFGTKARVVAGVGLLVGGKVCRILHSWFYINDKSAFSCLTSKFQSYSSNSLMHSMFP